MVSSGLFTIQYSFNSCFTNLDDELDKEIPETMLGFFVEIEEKISV